ncbi:MAG: UDP-N-acetylmuramoyl-tripeptide--D-alanyl-D-alanine ligase [Pyramidobacter sp.]|nr:UDP-N-acetylmuramoyl-tripeptide--D-alanyl-D-alanine ligase [Pyramidobacter sp.]
MNATLLARECGIVCRGPEVSFPLTIRVDSRETSAGEGFVALRGEHVDGHNFIPDVLAKGVSLVVCEQAAFQPEWCARFPQTAFLLTEERCEYGLAVLAGAYIRTLKCLKDFIAVTGSVGKTSTKNYTRALIEDHFKVHCAGRNYNTLIGCAVTILAAPEDTEILLLEMGANHSGEIAEMVRFMPPTTAVITEVAPVHVEGFGSLEAILAAKTEILKSAALKRAVLNGDNSALCSCAGTMNLPEVISFGRKGTVNFAGEHVSWANDHFKVDAVLTGLDGISFKISLPLFGTHQLYPLCCACALAGTLGLSTRDIAQNISKCRNSAGRGEIKMGAGGAVIVDECYNASPAAMKAALTALDSVELSGRRFLVLGSMRELGVISQKEHEKLLKRALQAGGEVFLYGAEWKTVPEALEFCFDSIDDLVLAVEARSPEKGDVILVKGSRGNHLEQVVRALEL